VATFAFLLALVTPPAAVSAQTGGVITGTVVSERGTPLSDAQIAVDGQTGTGGTTDAGGRFRLVNIAGAGQVDLTVRRIGFLPRTVTATIGASAVAAMSDM
jgi:phosphate/sulfate permease